LAQDLQFVQEQIAKLFARIHSIRGMLHGLHRALPSQPSRTGARPWTPDPRP
jgi:hypothetical protein